MTLLRGRLIVVGAVLTVLAGLGVAVAVLHSPAPALGTRGVDVSSHEHAGNAAINWPDVAAAGDSFAAIKVSEGTYYDNPYYASDAVQAARAGLFVMPYIFADPFDAKDNGSATQQVDMAVRQLSTVAVPASQMLPLALDIEPDPYAAKQKVNECYGLSPAAMVTWIRQFMAEARLKTGRKPVIYTSTAWWKACTGNSATFGSYPLWIMSWSPPAPTLPAGWNTYTFWQQTARGAVPGIAGSRTDEDYLARPASLQPSRLAWHNPAGRRQPAIGGNAVDVGEGGSTQEPRDAPCTPRGRRLQPAGPSRLAARRVLAPGVRYQWTTRRGMRATSCRRP